MPLPDNEQINKEFVVAVEEYPILYNYNLKEYSNRNEQDKAWRQLAAKLNATDSECKLRYKNIRGAFTRYLRNKNKTGSGAKKPYYLWEQLQFLLPYTKFKQQSSNLDFTSSHNPLNEPAHASEDEEDPEPQNPSINQSTNKGSVDMASGTSAASTSTTPPMQTSKPSSMLSAWCRSKIKTKKEDLLEKAVTSYFELKWKETKESESNADLDLKKSLLPDIKNLTPAKKRCFKRKVIEIIDELSEDD